MVFHPVLMTHGPAHAGASKTSLARELNMYHNLTRIVSFTGALLMFVTVGAFAQNVHPQYQSGNCNQQNLAFAIAISSTQTGVKDVVSSENPKPDGFQVLMPYTMIPISRFGPSMFVRPPP